MQLVKKMDLSDDIAWNVVTGIDVLEGLARLPDKSIDLGFADPPFNIGLENNPNNGKPFSRNNAKAIYYADDMDPVDYQNWCAAWLSGMMRVCNKVLVYCGVVNLPVFYRIDAPLDQIVYFMKFNTIITSTAWAGRYRPILVYADDKNAFLGRPPGQNCKFDSSVIVKKKRWFDSSEERDRGVLKHPCPIDRELINSIIVQLKPKSFLDIFVGSGTVIMIAKELGIPWAGFEINPDYSQDQAYLLGKARDRSATMKKRTMKQEALF